MHAVYRVGCGMFLYYTKYSACMLIPCGLQIDLCVYHVDIGPGR